MKVLSRLFIQSRTVWNCRLRAGLYLASLSALFYGIFPALIRLLTDTGQTVALFGLDDRRVLVLLLTPPLALGAWATLEFTDKGMGTPLPLDMPRKLVQTGPYAYVRNPMQITGLTLAAVQALAHPTPAMGLYIVALALLTMLVFRPCERFQMERAFGEDYVRYRQHVRNWLPRRTPYEAEAEKNERDDGL